MTKSVTTSTLAAHLGVSRVTIVRDLLRLKRDPPRILNGARLLAPEDIRAVTEFRRLRHERRQARDGRSVPAGGTE